MGDMGATNAEIIRQVMNDFILCQEVMLLAQAENANKTFERLKIQYLSLKALLNVLGVNLTDIDQLKL